VSTAFVAKARNLFGPLAGEHRERLEAVLANPTEQTWDDAYSLIVGGGFKTLWQAWIAVDPSAPRSKPLEEPWPKIPDQLTLYRALKEATK
jgi:hypothetical protein